MRTLIISLVFFLNCIIFVTGLNAQNTKDSTLTTSFNQVISGDDFNRPNLIDPLQLIKGQATGISLNKKGSDPNVANTTTIRGVSTEFDPGILYIIDGIYGADPQMLLPDDIESLEIVKDAASLAIYGSQGISGAIIITTKRYKTDKKLKVNFNSYLSLNTASKHLKLLSADKYRSIINDNIPDQVFNDGGADTDWQDAILRTTLTQVYKLSISTKVKNTHLHVSAFNQDNPGIVVATARNNSGLNAHVSQDLLDNRINLHASVSLLRAKSELLPPINQLSSRHSSIFFQALTRNPTDPIFQPDGTTYHESYRSFSYLNPLAILDSNSYTIVSNNTNLNLGATFSITQALTLDINTGYTTLKQVQEYTRSMIFYGSLFDEPFNETGEKKNFNLQTGLNYKTDIGEFHHISLRVAYANRMMDFNSQTDVEKEYLDDYFYAHNRKINNYIGQLEYNFRDRYFLSMLGNYETSNFVYDQIVKTDVSKVNHTAIYSSVVIGWKAHKENFLKNIRLISDFTFKAGYGVTGNAQADYLYFMPTLHLDEDFKMEKLKELTLNVNLGILKNRLSGSLTYYSRINKNAIAEIRFPAPYSAYGNAATYKSKGIELSVNAIPISREHVKWSTMMVYYRNNHQMVNDFYESTITGGAWSTNPQILQSNGSVFYLPVLAGYTEDGHVLYFTESGTKTRDLYRAKFQIMSQTVPKYVMGFTNSVKIMSDFNISFTMMYCGGYSIYNSTRMALSDRYFLSTLNISEEGAQNVIDGYDTAPLIDLYLEDASYLRMEDLTLSYTIKPTKAKFGESLELILSATNLFTLSKFTGYDPAGLSNGVDYFNVYPLARTFTFGIKLGI